MNATPRNKKSSRKQKGRIPTNKLREQQPCQIPAYPSTSPRKERQSKPLFFQDSETTHHHKNQPLLSQEEQAKGGLPITKETCHKDGKGLPPSKNKPPFFQKVKQKEEEPVSPTLPVYPRLPYHSGSLE